MQETERSLSLYFILSGVVGIVLGIMVLMSKELDGMVLFTGIPTILFSCAYLYFGVRLGPLLESSTELLVVTLSAGLAYVVILFVLSLNYAESGAAGRLIWPILITAYLIRNVRRLGR